MPARYRTHARENEKIGWSTPAILPYSVIALFEVSQSQGLQLGGVEQDCNVSGGHDARVPILGSMAI